MNNKDLSIIIISCDKNQDLAPFIKKTYHCFLQAGCEVMIISDSFFEAYKDLNFFKVDTANFTDKLKEGINHSSSNNVLVLLDDYYVVDKDLDNKLTNWLKAMNNNNLSVIKISKDFRPYRKLKKCDKETKIFKNIRPYDIDFHPTIWNKNTYIDFLSFDKLSAWEIEPLFAKYLNDDIRVGLSNQKVEFSELIVGGKFFRKPFFKYCKKEYVGDKKVLSIGKTCAFYLKRFFYRLTPKTVVNWFNKIFKRKTYTNSTVK